MLTSKWRVRSHRYLGTVHVPIIDLEIQDARGNLVPFSLCVDSGAVISLLPRSAAHYLGLEFSSDRSIDLGGVGHYPVRARLHDLSIHLTGLPPVVVPFAIAEQDSVPGLLGRMGIFDRFEITFDPVQHETRLRSAKE